MASLPISTLSSNTYLTSEGIYIINSSGGDRTIYLPLLSTVGSNGMGIKIIRDGANSVTVQRQGSDTFWDSTTTRDLDDDGSAVSVCAPQNASHWNELGRYRTVT